MHRKKPPVLTSPWKVGFFVSLMLVAVSIGVAYYFMRTFGLSWGLSPFAPSLEWLRTEVWGDFPAREGLLVRTWPLLVLVGAAALISHSLIARAVRKYRGYLDSGLDYKNLLSSIREIKDFDDKKQIAKLKNHPELKKFLTRVRDSVVEREKQLVEREKEAEASVEAAEGRIEEELAEQCDALIDAIRRGSPGKFTGSPAVNVVPLKRVEDAMCEAFLSMSNGSDAGPAAEGRLRDQLAEIAAALEGNTLRTKEIGKQVGRLSTGAAKGGDNTGKLEDVAASLRSLNDLSSAVKTLSEETKGIAINAALQASSGEGGRAEIVQVAEDVKEIAAKFSDISRSYASVTANLQESVSALDTGVGPGLAKATKSIVDKLAVLAERTSILSGQVGDLQDPGGTAPTAASDGGGSPGGVDPEIGDDYGFEKLDSRKPLFSDEADAVADVAEEDGLLAGAEVEDGMFADLSSKGTAGASGTGDSDYRESTPLESADLPAVDAGSMNLNEIDLGGEDPADRRVAQSKPPPVAKAPRPTPAEPDEKVPSSPAPVPGPASDDDDTADLYAIGAVDFDPALHG